MLQSCENIGAGFLNAAVRMSKQNSLIGGTIFLKRLTAEVATGISDASIAAYGEHGAFKAPTMSATEREADILAGRLW